jgi:HlyD family secretion protein
MAASPNRRYWIIGGIVFSAIVILIIVGRLKGPRSTEVATEAAEVRTIYAKVTETGVIQPTVDVPVAPDVSGEVVFIAVREGMKVKKGDLLVTIRPDDYRSILEQSTASLDRTRAAYLQAQAATAQAKANYLQDSVNFKRSDGLYKDRVISQADWENARLRLNVARSNYDAAAFSEQAAKYQIRSAESSLKQARQNLDRTNIYASMDGTITQLNIELGQRVVGTAQMAGTEILKIANLSSMEVVVNINENDIVNVKLGDSARIEVDALPGKVYYGTVAEIAYSAKSQTGAAAAVSTDQVTNFEVEVRITPASYEPQHKNLAPGESPFRPGMTALVEIYTESKDKVVAVPIQAVTLRSPEAKADSASEKEVVFVYENGKVRQQDVKTGISDDFFIEVTEGLQAGAQVVVGPFNVLSQTLKDGAEVTLKKDEADKKDKAKAE